MTIKPNCFVLDALLDLLTFKKSTTYKEVASVSMTKTAMTLKILNLNNKFIKKDDKGNIVDTLHGAYKQAQANTKMSEFEKDNKVWKYETAFYAKYIKVFNVSDNELQELNLKYGRYQRIEYGESFNGIVDTPTNIKILQNAGIIGWETKHQEFYTEAPGLKAVWLGLE